MPLPDSAQEALQTLSDALRESPMIARDLFDRWRPDALTDGVDAAISPAADELDRTLPEASFSMSRDEAAALLKSRVGEVVFVWLAANADRSDARLHFLIEASLALPAYEDQALVVARNRLVQGPLDDALSCAPLMGAGTVFNEPANFEARARMEILLWEAGACGLELPALGAWIWARADTFEAVVAGPARGTLRGRVIAARCLEVAACGLSPMTDQRLVGRTLQVLQPLLLHPEPMVWIHAARAFGRLAGAFEPLEGTLLDWVHGATPVLRQRALTAFASLPKSRLAMLGHELESILESPEEAAWGLAAAAAATPYLFHSRRKLWDRLAERILEGDGGAVAARALGRGLATLWRRGEDREAIGPTFRRLRTMARRARGERVDDWRRWVELIAVTDPIDAAERDPLDIEMGLENLVRIAAQYDDEEADARAARFASTLAPTFTEARRIVLGDGSLRHRAAGLNAFEGCARSLALRLWGPMLATRPKGVALKKPDLSETWEVVARTPAELLDLVRARRQDDEERDDNYENALEVLALKLGGYALDAVGEDSELGPGRGPVAHDTCLWLRKLDGLADGSRELPPQLRSALSALFWRLIDATRGTALGEVDDVAWLGPFAAWWALVIDRPALLSQLATALPMIADGALDTCTSLADRLREAVRPSVEDGAFRAEAASVLGELQAGDTELAASLDGFAHALEAFAPASGRRKDLEAMCLELVLASERFTAALVDPVRALHPAADAPTDDSLASRMSENSPRTAAVVARAIRARDPSLLEVWFASLGPVASALVDASVMAAVRRTPPPPPAKKVKEPRVIEGYELVSRLGEGGIGSVWLVRKPGADRYFVLKIPKADALQNATDTEREGILASFVDEAKALAGLYHPNVANIIDRGITGDVPFLVLEYLIGADLKMYSDAKHMNLFELRSVIQETCLGLAALHNAGLVHRDIKPANLWLRLPLNGGVRFDPEAHRNPAHAQPLSTVIIDFGMVRAMRVSAEVGGRFVAGTPGYIAPEQVLDPVELDGRADVYALAGTLYNVTTGRTFFDEIEDPRQRIIAHMRQDPMEDLTPFKHYPAGLLKLMRAATALDFKDRPTPIEFGREFALLI